MVVVVVVLVRRGLRWLLLLDRGCGNRSLRFVILLLLFTLLSGYSRRRWGPGRDVSASLIFRLGKGVGRTGARSWLRG